MVGYRIMIRKEYSMTQKKQNHKSGKQICDERNNKNKMKEFLKFIQENEEWKLPDLTGETTIISEDVIKRGVMSDKFLQWYNKHIGWKFTIKGKAEGFNNFYELVGVENWIFCVLDLLDTNTGKRFKGVDLNAMQ